MSIEAGGNAPFIVFDDADIEKAVEGSIPISRDARTLFVHAAPIQALSQPNSADRDRPVSVPTASTSNRPSTPTLPLDSPKKWLLLRSGTDSTKRRTSFVRADARS
jgi:hypothetical protein